MLIRQHVLEGIKLHPSAADAMLNSCMASILEVTGETSAQIFVLGVRMQNVYSATLCNHLRVLLGGLRRHNLFSIWNKPYTWDS